MLDWVIAGVDFSRSSDGQPRSSLVVRGRSSGLTDGQRKAFRSVGLDVRDLGFSLWYGSSGDEIASSLRGEEGGYSDQDRAFQRHCSGVTAASQPWVAAQPALGGAKDQCGCVLSWHSRRRGSHRPWPCTSVAPDCRLECCRVRSSGFPFRGVDRGKGRSQKVLNIWDLDRMVRT